MGYRRLAHKDRYQIEALVSSQSSCRSIARQLGRAPSTISREIKKGLGKSNSYSAAKASERTDELRAGRYTKKIHGTLETHIRSELLKDHSPEQISNRLKETQPAFCVSHPTIYRFIRTDKRSGGNLWKHLRVLRRQRRDRRYPNWRSQHAIPDRVFIAERAESVEKRERLGDYERDTILGTRGGRALLTIVDRRSRYTWIALLQDKLAKLVHDATIACLRSEAVHTITNDNGSEFALHKDTAKALETKIYFSKAYRSWERGTVENTNGLLRQYFPKKKPIPDISPQDLMRIQNLLNTRPRKCLGYKTPMEVQNLLKSGVALEA